MKHLDSINDIYDYMTQFEFGWMDFENNVYHSMDKGFKKKYVLSSPEEVEKNGVGTSFDLVELERTFFKNLNVKFNTYFMIYYDSKRIFTHSFVVYEEKEKFYWFETSWANDKGIHEYSSLFDLLTEVRSKFKVYNEIKFMDFDYLCVYKYKKPKWHLNLKDYYKHCEGGENVII